MRIITRETLARIFNRLGVDFRWYALSSNDFFRDSSGVVTVTPKIVFHDPSESFPNYEAQLVYSASPSESLRNLVSEIRYKKCCM